MSTRVFTSRYWVAVCPRKSVLIRAIFLSAKHQFGRGFGPQHIEVLVHNDTPSLQTAVEPVTICQFEGRARISKSRGKRRLLPTVVQGLTQAVVSDQEGINLLMDQGQKMRTVGATAMNETSSRSHSIFTIVVEINDVDEAGKDHIRVGKASKTKIGPLLFYFSRSDQHRLVGEIAKLGKDARAEVCYSLHS